MKTLKYFFQRFKANKQSHFINMLSLIPGLACCLLILVWLVSQIGVDRFYPKIDRIVTVSGYHEGQEPFHGAPPAVAPTLKQELPEVEASARIAWAPSGLSYKNENFNVATLDADEEIFEIFDFRFIDGVPFSAEELDKCVISESCAKIIFGEKSPLGEILEFEFGEFAICGVFENNEGRSTVAGLSQSANTLFLPIKRYKDNLNYWYNNSYETYLLLSHQPNIDEFSAKIKDRAMEAQPQNQLYLKAFMLKDRYLYRYNQIAQVRLMGFITLIILIVACINFINLTTAEFGKSTFQTGIRKILGATRKNLIFQNLINTSILVVISFLLAYLLALAILPFFNKMLNSGFAPSDLFAPTIIGVSLVILLTTALLAGIYPAISISSFNPADTLKKYRSGKSVFRQALVVIQFTIGIVLIVSTMVVRKQIGMYNSMDLGYNYDEVLYVTVPNGEPQKKSFALKEELQKEPFVRSVSHGVNLPTSIYWNGVGWSWEGKAPDFNPLISFNYVDEDWFDVFDIRLADGEFFSKDKTGIIINKELANLIGGDSPVGKFMQSNGQNYQIIGLLDEFAFNNFKAESSPLIIFPLDDDSKNYANYMSIRITGTDISSMYDVITAKASETFGKTPSIGFMNDNVENWLSSEKQTSIMVSFFSILAIVISCMGLFGLATFVITQKQKEIGIRRVNGAKVGEIIRLLNFNFLKPVLISFVIACPAAHYIMNQWLKSYMQRTEISWWLFVVAGAGVALITIATLTWHSVKAANTNPVETLRNE